MVKLLKWFGLSTKSGFEFKELQLNTSGNNQFPSEGILTFRENGIETEICFYVVSMRTRPKND